MATSLIPSFTRFLLPRSSPSLTLTPKTPKTLKPTHAQIPFHQNPPFLPIAFSFAAAIVASPLPAVAAEIEKAALFDFNLTLPAIAAEFLLLMVALDKLYFTPLGKFMDDRDASIRAQLGDVKDMSAEVKALEDEGAAKLKAARAEVAAALNQMKRETAAELEAKFAERKGKVEEELEKALAALQLQKEETLKSLDSQIDLLSAEIVSKVLPSGSSS